MLFRKKKKVNKEELKEILIRYIQKSRIKGIADKDILKKMIKRKYPIEIIEESFNITNNFKQLNKKQEVKMGKDYEDEDYEDDEEDMEDEDLEEDEEPIKETPKIKKKKQEKTKIEKEQTENTGTQLAEILSNHEQRLQSIESALFRLKGSI